MTQPRTPYPILTARAAQDFPAEISAARCVELSGDVPEWVELLPAGPEVQGRDGRSWRLTDAAAVRLGATHIHALVVEQAATRQRIEEQLLAALDLPLNVLL